ncbi:hypothetical protein [Azohydromonas lata]|uniref:Uncharacterized protein n=1 Tax=Azohydromonas lata TaxID=45677 RepID=A0ABU5IR62_9BURK|nr:hypothetical protein [Azohydromonas lata]MDZ5461355.1 hypothetical protein [Azohydromonas lata]
MGSLIEESLIPAWGEAMPAGYEDEVVLPWRFTQHEDEQALATKLIGLDAQGRRCWIRHDHTAVAVGFDMRELPIARPIAHERRTAWRLRSGQWLLCVNRVERLDSARPRVENRPVVITREEDLGL